MMMMMIPGTLEILTSIIAICKSECNPRKNYVTTCGNKDE
jgi:hypothetical protein